MTQQAAQKPDLKPKEPDDRLVEVTVAIPGKVGRGSVGVDFCDHGETIRVSDKNADDLELNGLAFRDKNEAAGAYKTWQRKKEQERKELAAAAKQRGEGAD